MDTTPFASTGNISITAEGDIHVNVTGATTITITSTKGAIELNSLTGNGKGVQHCLLQKLFMLHALT